MIYSGRFSTKIFVSASWSVQFIRKRLRKAGTRKNASFRAVGSVPFNPNEAGGGAKRQLATRQVGPVEMVIGAWINLHLDFGAAGGRAVKKDFARRRGNPDILGADQYQKRDGIRPRCLLTLLVARCRIEGDRRPKVALRQLGRSAQAMCANSEQNGPRPIWLASRLQGGCETL